VEEVLMSQTKQTHPHVSSIVVPYITLIQAPGIPRSEVKALREHYQEAISDSEYTVVMNYDARVDQVEIPKGARLFVTAPGVPTKEVTVLRKMVDKARRASKPQDRLVVLNYECRIDVVC
jgi:hypothetical protein